MWKRSKAPLEEYEPIGVRRVSGSPREAALLFVSLLVSWIVVHLLLSGWRPEMELPVQVLVTLVVVVIARWYGMQND